MTKRLTDIVKNQRTNRSENPDVIYALQQIALAHQGYLPRTEEFDIARVAKGLKKIDSRIGVPEALHYLEKDFPINDLYTKAEEKGFGAYIALRKGFVQKEEEKVSQKLTLPKPGTRAYSEHFAKLYKIGGINGCLDRVRLDNVHSGDEEKALF